MWEILEPIGQWIVTGIVLVLAIAKAIALWFVPLAVVVYVVTYFVMAIILVLLWSNGRHPTIPAFLQRWCKGRSWVR